MSGKELFFELKALSNKKRTQILRELSVRPNDYMVAGTLTSTLSRQEINDMFSKAFDEVRKCKSTNIRKLHFFKLGI